jgi:protein-L-isoaspartate(D-aspartate) O-methyltransferase
MAAIVARYGVRDERVLEALRTVRRHRFFPVPGISADTAYGDHPVPIGAGQTISQPYIVAYMTARLELHPGMRVLEVGTGSGYQAAVLAACGAVVYTLERIPGLAEHARRILEAEGFCGVQVRCADGYDGWREAAPFDGIIGTCAPPEIPPSLVEQLADGGRMVLPVGEDSQCLFLLRRQGRRVSCVSDIPVRFVPMVTGVAATG